MECRISGVAIHYVVHGSGRPLVALHGAGVDHREVEAALEAAVSEAVVSPPGLRRIYPDLPGMGRSTTGGLASNDDVVGLLAEFIEHLAMGPALVVGHSYGAYLARGLAAHRPDLVRGLALVCPIAEGARDAPEHEVVRQDADAYDELDAELRDGFDEYFVVRTTATARRYRDDIAPGIALANEPALARIFSRWAVDLGVDTFAAATLIVSGRRDSVVGFTDAGELLKRYPRASFSLIEDDPDDTPAPAVRVRLGTFRPWTIPWCAEPFPSR
jgi:pimeloyl-ACP methyl ester carboxylesterase